MYVSNIKTPLLMITGSNDMHVPATQSQELYTALTIQHKPVKWLTLPEQEHGPTDPDLIESAITQTESWLDRVKL